MQDVKITCDICHKSVSADQYIEERFGDGLHDLCKVCHKKMVKLLGKGRLVKTEAQPNSYGGILGKLGQQGTVIWPPMQEQIIGVQNMPYTVNTQGNITTSNIQGNIESDNAFIYPVGDLTNTNLFSQIIESSSIRKNTNKISAPIKAKNALERKDKQDIEMIIKSFKK
jgi:hypothetical protein